MNIWETFYRELIVFGLSMMPVSEIRGSIIYGFSAMGKDLYSQIIVYIISVIGNFLPVPFILLLFRPVLKLLKKIRIFSRFSTWLETRTRKKRCVWQKSVQEHCLYLLQSRFRPPEHGQGP